MLIQPNCQLRYFPVYLFCLLSSFMLASCKKHGKEVPDADFTFTKNCSAAATCQVTFTDRSKNADSYEWDFGDGQRSHEENPVHTFSKAKDFYVVSLRAGNLSGSSDSKSDTVFLSEKPKCENIGSFKCASKLLSGITIRDQITNPDGNNYYYFIMPSPGVARIKFSPVPSGGYFYVDVLKEARDNSPVIRSVYATAGETILYFAGPLEKDSFFVRVNPPSTAGREFYDISFTYNGDDANEINNVFSQATPLVLSTPKAGTILAEDDLDFFKFHLSQSRIVDVNVDPVPNFPSNGTLTVDAFAEANANSLIKSVYGYPGEIIRLSLGPLDTGWHYLRLKANNRESPDKYFITVVPDAKDLNEVNNTFGTATTLQANQVKLATIKAAGDLDYYKYTAVSNTTGKIEIDNVPTGLSYMYVEVYNAASSSAKTDSKYSTVGNAIALNTAQPFVAGQTYFIKVFSYYSTEQSNDQYQIKIYQ